MGGFSTLGQRIKYGLSKSGKTQADLSRYTGIKTATVSQWCSDKVKNLKSDNALNVSRFLGVDYNWLVTGRGSPETKQEEANVNQLTSNDNSNYTTIPYKRITFQCGEGYEPSYEDLLDETFIKLENKFFVDNQVSPNHCICVKVEGDSMEPLIYNGEYVVIDQNERNNIKEGKV